MSLVLNVEILGEFRQLTSATKGAQSELGTLNDHASKISSSINKAFGAIGLGLSFAVITRELTEAGKAAAEDVKSQTLLARQMQNTIGATDGLVSSTEKYISKLQLQTNIADTDLRKSYAILIRGTNDAAEANKLLALATDISAGSGKSLDAVSVALAKSLAGSDTALTKLLPSVKGMKDPVAELEKQFGGMAEAAADTDPYTTMQTIFGEMQEQIGMALLPTLSDFSEWLSTPEGQEKLQLIVDGITGIITELTKWVDWVIENQDFVIGLGGAIAGIGIALKTLETISALSAPGINANFLKAFGWTAVVITALETIIWLQSQLDFNSQNIAASGGKAGALNFSGQSGAKPSAGGSNMVLGNVVNQNITIQGTQSAQQIKLALERAKRANGTSSLGGL